MNVQGRAEELARRIREKHAAQHYLFAAVACNGCGRIVSAPNPDALALHVYDWEISPDYGGLDYCPACKEKTE